MNYRKKHGSKPKTQPTSFSLPEVEYSNPGMIRTLSTSRLTSGLPYQRPVEQKNVDELIRKWNDRELTPITVSFRDGKFNVVDGQNRIAAMRQMAGGGDVIVPCMIHTGLTYQEEAELYAKLDRANKPLTARQQAKALIEASSDPKMLEISRLVEAAGFTWALDTQTGEAFEISTVRTLVRAYELLGGEGFSRMLTLLAGAWHGTPYSLKATFLSGMALFLKTYETEFSDEAFVRRLSAVSPGDILSQGRVDNNAALRHARILWEHYNAQAVGGPQLPYRFKR